MLFTTALDFEVVHSIFTNLGSKHLPVRSAIRVVWLMPKSLEVTCQRNPISCLEITPSANGLFPSFMCTHHAAQAVCISMGACLRRTQKQLGLLAYTLGIGMPVTKKQRALNKLCSIVQPSISLKQNFSGWRPCSSFWSRNDDAGMATKKLGEEN
jgi:hypothetical protein